MNETKNLPAYDPLMAFANWLIQQPGYAIPLSQHKGVTRIGSFSGLVLFRQPPFQAQLWICDPGSHIPKHRHPNVDQIHVFISGNAAFNINDKPAIPVPAIAKPDGVSSLQGMIARVMPGDTEEAFIGEQGWAFVTIQHWLKGEPTSAELDWQGDYISDEHRLQVEAPNAA